MNYSYELQVQIYVEVHTCDLWIPERIFLFKICGLRVKTELQAETDELRD